MPKRRAAASIPAEPTASQLLQGQSKRGRVIKRAGDIVFSLLVLVLGSPLFLLLALLVKLSSKGSVFYSQRRIGRGYKRQTTSCATTRASPRWASSCAAPALMSCRSS